MSKVSLIELRIIGTVYGGEATKIKTVSCKDNCAQYLITSSFQTFCHICTGYPWLHRTPKELWIQCNDNNDNNFNSNDNDHNFYFKNIIWGQKVVINITLWKYNHKLLERLPKKWLGAKNVALVFVTKVTFLAADHFFNKSFFLTEQTV